MDRIKESFDSLPIAACFFDKNGGVRLITRRMLAIANWLRKGGIQSLAEMQSALHAPPANVRCLDLRLQIFRFQLVLLPDQLRNVCGGDLGIVDARFCCDLLLRKAQRLPVRKAVNPKTQIQTAHVCGRRV